VPAAAPGLLRPVHRSRRAAPLVALMREFPAARSSHLRREGGYPSPDHIMCHKRDRGGPVRRGRDPDRFPRHRRPVAALSCTTTRFRGSAGSPCTSDAAGRRMESPTSSGWRSGRESERQAERIGGNRSPSPVPPSGIFFQGPRRACGPTRRRSTGTLLVQGAAGVAGSARSGRPRFRLALSFRSTPRCRGRLFAGVR